MKIHGLVGGINNNYSVDSERKERAKCEEAGAKDTCSHGI